MQPSHGSTAPGALVFVACGGGSTAPQAHTLGIGPKRPGKRARASERTRRGTKSGAARPALVAQARVVSEQDVVWLEITMDDGRRALMQKGERLRQFDRPSAHELHSVRQFSDKLMLQNTQTANRSLDTPQCHALLAICWPHVCQIWPLQLFALCARYEV